MMGAKKLLVIVIAVLIVGLIIIYASGVEVPLWTLQFTFYAFMTAFFGFIFAIIRDFRFENVEKRFDEKEALESLKKEYERCAWAIENNIEKHVEKNEIAGFKASVVRSWLKGEAKISEEIESQVQEYNEKLELYHVLCRASRTQVESIVENEVRQKFPKTLRKRVRLGKILQRGHLMARYFNGEKVTDSWLKENNPERRRELIDALDESEKDKLDILFHQLNDDLKNDPILQRFRKEKEELVEHGRKTVKNLKIEIDSLNEQLKKYSDLRYENTSY